MPIHMRAISRETLDFRVIWTHTRNNPGLGIMPQGVDTDALGNAGACRGQANEPMKLARAHVLPAVAGKQPRLAGRHPSLLARHPPPFAQQLEKVGRENDIAILLALALFDPDDHSVLVDIGELERYDLR